MMAMANKIEAALAHGGASGPDLDSNFLLHWRQSLANQAKKAGVANAVIDRAIDRGAGKGSGDALEKHAYEGSRGPALFIVEVLTDSKNRAVADVRHVFRKYGGSLSPNSARFAFQIVWVMEVGIPSHKNEGEVALDALELDLDSDYFEEMDTDSPEPP